MITSRLVYTRVDGVSATVKRFHLFGYLVAWRTADTVQEYKGVEFSAGSEQIERDLKRAIDAVHSHPVRDGRVGTIELPLHPELVMRDRAEHVTVTSEL